MVRPTAVQRPPVSSPHPRPGRGRAAYSRSVGGVGIGLLALFAAAFVPLPARAQDILPTDAKIVVHLVPATGTIGCNSSKGKIACDQMKVEGELNQPYYAFVCIIDADATLGISGLQFGVEYNRSNSRGVDIFDWNKCGTLEFPTNGSQWYKNAGGGNLVTWDVTRGCPRDEPGGSGTGVVVVAGYFYLSAYSDDRLKITKRPVDNFAKIADCEGQEYGVEGFGFNYPRPHLGYATFSSDPGASANAGYNPCGDNQFVRTTISKLKAGDTGR